MRKIPKKIQRLIEDVVKEYKSKPTITSILLFGSFAKGTFHKNSDIDIEIIHSGKKYSTIKKNVDGTKIDIELWPREKLIKDFKKNPFLKYPYLSEKMLYDPTGFAKRFKKEVRGYFDKNPKIRRIWIQSEKDYLESKKQGKKPKSVNLFYKKLKKICK